MERRVERIRVAQEKLPQLSARQIARALERAARARGRASFCLAGGTTPKACYEELAREPAVPWQKVSIYFGDERCVTPDHPDSNYLLARTALLSRVPIPPENVHRMRGELADRQAAAREYDESLPDAIDVMLLGIGEDGHTASLFPGSPALDETRARVLPVIGPKPPPERLTLTQVPLRAAREVFVLAAGANKADAVARALEGKLDIPVCPVQLVRDAVWLMDHAAAAKLGGAFADH
jgi:6-phosphogluconolactonase